jgi:predicted metal-dependent hydrolase
MREPLPLAVRQFNAREFFDCHETLEEAWMHETQPRKLFLQSIIHFAVALYHVERDNRIGAVRQLRKAIRKLAPYVPEYEGIDTDALLRRAFETLRAVQRGEPVEYPQVQCKR